MNRSNHRSNANPIRALLLTLLGLAFTASGSSWAKNSSDSEKLATGAWADLGRLTHMGPDLDRDFDAREPAAAYNTTNDEYLVVWEGTDSRSGMTPGEAEIYGQRVSGVSGELLGETAFRISTMGPNFSASYDARSPSVAYNVLSNEYLVVWYGDDTRGTLVEGEFEIFGQRIDAATGQEIGEDDFRISTMGPDTNRDYDAVDPEVAYGSIDNRYLVVWRGEDGVSATPVGQFEVYGQLIDGSDGSLVGPDNFAVSTMGPEDNADFDAFSPVVAYNQSQDEFLVVWYGNDDRSGLASNEMEVYAQRVDGLTGSELGGNDIRISTVGDDGDATRNAQHPALSYDDARNQYLVVWSADDTHDGSLDDEYEIYGRLLDATATPQGPDDFAISKMGGSGETLFDAFRPKTVYDPADDAFIVVWRGDGEVDGEFEIHLQRLDAGTTVPLAVASGQKTHAGPDGDFLFDARRADLTVNPQSGGLFMVWEQENSDASQSEGEFELFGATLIPADHEVSPITSGSWYDPLHDGEGWVVEILPNGVALVYWFTYDPSQPVQTWILGVGNVVGNRIVVAAAETFSGPTFGSGYDSAALNATPWGSFAIEFAGDGTATIGYDGKQTFGSGLLAPQLIANLAGTSDGAVASGLVGLSGSWYDSSHNGEGWVLEYLGGDQFLVYWFTYDSSGNPAWLLGIGTLVGNTLTFSEMTITNGTVFGPTFDPSAINYANWGSLTMTVSCDLIDVNYVSSDPDYGSGSLSATRLTTPDGTECSL